MTWIWNIIKKIAKKKSFWIILIIVIIAIVYFSNSGGPKVVYTTENVQRGNLIQTVSETGSIESASAIDLNFKGSGVLAAVNVKEGSKVQAGDVLARLDAGSLEISVRQAQANLSVARASLDKLLAGASSEDLNVSEAQVNNAKIAMDNAQLTFNNIETQSSKNISDLRVSLTNEIDKQIAICRSALDAIKLIFDNSYLTYQFSVKSPQYGINANNYYDESKVRLQFAETALSELKANDNDENLAQAVNKLNDAQSWIKNSLDNTYLGLINTLVGNSYNETMWNTDKANITNQQSIINAGITSLNVANQNYTNSKLNYDSNYTQAKTTLDSATGAYNLALAQYELKKAKPRNVDIAGLQAQVDQARAAYDLALNNLDDYIIYAPTDGIVTFVNYKRGEQVSMTATKPAIAMIGNSDFQINVDVPESNIIKIKVGNETNITLDAYGSDVNFKGKVVFIDPAETVIQDVVYYKITVELEPSENKIKSGMTANVDIITATVDNVLFLSNRAVKTDENGSKYVEVKKLSGGEEKINIEVGIRADTGTEIKSGLKEGQEVIVSKK